MSYSILIVDDNEKNLKLARVFLQSAGYATAEAADGVSALRIAREGRFDLVLLDIQMPRLDGRAVLRALRDEPRTSGIPVVALTSFAMKGDRERFLDDGFQGYVAKPIERVAFLDAVRGIIGQGGAEVLKEGEGDPAPGAHDA